MTPTLKLNPADLRQRFTGTENYYRHALNQHVLFTDGVKFVADYGGAYWLLDIIALAQRYDKAIGGARFQVWKLTVHSNRSATLTVEDGNLKTIYHQALDYTDFPATEITFWYANGVIYLPSEH